MRTSLPCIANSERNREVIDDILDQYRANSAVVLTTRTC
ncbi:hypothetical protein SynA1528_02593 [Synechococcus sp. A15-28]|nr:hypothetical protein SynA1528_02593 [Synechococcus sp. A15-28]